MKKLLKIISYKDYLFCYLIILAIAGLSYYPLREIMLDQRGWFIVRTSPLTLNTLAVFFLALYIWNKYASIWIKIKSKKASRIVEYGGAIVIILVFYLFLQQD